MTKLNDTFHLTKENIRISTERADSEINLEQSHQSRSVEGKTCESFSELISEKDDIFMQLQTELLDILLEIHYVIPAWGSFKENFYFHWKRIIGASNVKELHAYRLIFRCLGSLRPSSIPLFILKPIIKQLDEYRKISEPDYFHNLDINAGIQRHTVSSCHAPIAIIQRSQSLNLPTTIDNRDILALEGKYNLNGLFSKSDNLDLAQIIYNDKPNMLAFVAGELNKMSDVIPTFIDQKDSISPCYNKDKSKVFTDGECNIQLKNSNSITHEFYSASDKEIILKEVPFEDGNLNSHVMTQNNDLVNIDKKSNFEESELSKLTNDTNEPTNNYLNSMGSTTYSSTCTTSSISPSKYNMAGPIIAAFQHIQAVAVATAVANQTKTISNSTNINESEVPQPPKKRPRRNGEIQGVYFDKIRKLWRANWKENGRVKTKGFSVFQFGDEGARQKAIEYRRKMEKEFYAVSSSSKYNSNKVSCKNILN